MGMSDSHTQFVPLDVLAVRLGLPVAWLRREADAERLPCLKVGNRRRLFDVNAVQRALAKRTEAGVAP